MIEIMKKIILMVSMAAFALVSCNKDFVVEENHGSKIEFRTAVDTRATEITLDDVAEFEVVALYEDYTEYFTDTFKRTNGYVYESDTDHLWPADDELTFFAYYPSAKDLGVAESIKFDANQRGFKGYTPNSNIGLQKDFIAAVAVAKKEDSAAGVALEFKHQLSQIEIKAKNTNEGYTVKIMGAKIMNVAGSGDFDFTAAVKNWTPSDDVTASYNIEWGSEVVLGKEPVSLMGDNGNAMLIPQTRIAWGPAVAPEQTPEQTNEAVDGDGDGDGDGAEAGGEVEETPEETPETPVTDPTGSYITFLIQVNSPSGSRIFPYEAETDYAWVVCPIAFDWAAGYKYTYVCDFANGLGVLPETGEEILGGKIEISENFSGWEYNNFEYIEM